MGKYRLSGKVTISVSTVVEAGNKEQAIKIASKRENMEVIRDSYYSEDSFWVIEGELDGEVFDINTDE